MKKIRMKKIYIWCKYGIICVNSKCGTKRSDIIFKALEFIADREKLKICEVAEDEDVTFYTRKEFEFLCGVHAWDIEHV